MEEVQYKEQWQEDIEKPPIVAFLVFVSSALFVIALGYSAWVYWPWKFAWKNFIN